MKAKKIIYIIVIAICISNLPIFNFFAQEDFTYSNADRSFTYSEEGGKGKSFWVVNENMGIFFVNTQTKIKVTIISIELLQLNPGDFGNGIK